MERPFVINVAAVSEEASNKQSVTLAEAPSMLKAFFSSITEPRLLLNILTLLMLTPFAYTTRCPLITTPLSAPAAGTSFGAMVTLSAVIKAKYLASAGISYAPSSSNKVPSADIRPKALFNVAPLLIRPNCQVWVRALLPSLLSTVALPS